MGIVAGFGIFDDFTMFRRDFCVHFTNLSNYFCIAVMVASLVQTAKKEEDSYVTAVPVLKFIGVLAIVLTFVVFNVMPAGAEGRDPQLNWRVGSVPAHIVLPIMYIVDWFWFRERGALKWHYPIACVAFPLAYMAFIFIQAAILKFDTSILIPNSTTSLIYPCFFVNPETRGVGGVAKWAVLMFVGFMEIGYLFCGIDRLLCRKGKRKQTKNIFEQNNLNILRRIES